MRQELCLGKPTNNNFFFHSSGSIFVEIWRSEKAFFFLKNENKGPSRIVWSISWSFNQIYLFYDYFFVKPLDKPCISPFKLACFIIQKWRTLFSLPCASPFLLHGYPPQSSSRAPSLIFQISKTERIWSSCKKISMPLMLKTSFPSLSLNTRTQWCRQAQTQLNQPHFN